MATTRPELLPACVAVFVHPEDDRFRHLVGHKATVPFFGQDVRLLTDPAAEPEKGTGAVMCCTFGDSTDVAWWYTYDLDLVEAIGRDGRLTSASGDFAGMTVASARERIKQVLAESDLITGQRSTSQSLRVHERCDTPVEYVVAWQWFVRVLKYKEALLAAGEQVRWRPSHMRNRYRQWVENLSWDWCVSRQRYFGVPFPIWYCDECDEIITAEPGALPIDPSSTSPSEPCDCGNSQFTPETDVMDTWATSSITPQLVGQLIGTGGFDGQRFLPVSLRPQAHEIIRTWAFYSIVKAFHHFGIEPWKEVAISGWGLAPEGAGKISKSRGGGPVSPLQMIERYSADAVRYWAASTGLGKDAFISEEKIQAGSKLVTKLWNVARFSQRFLADYQPPSNVPVLSLSDRWILNRLHETNTRASAYYAEYDYAAAKSIVESFFWTDLADNYLELIKRRLYESAEGANGENDGAGARYALYYALFSTIKLLAPVLPYVTEEIYCGLFRGESNPESIHVSSWPVARPSWVDERASRHGQILISVATTVRRYKSQNNLSLSAELAMIHLAVDDLALAQALEEAREDIASITRARVITIGARPNPALLTVEDEGAVTVGLATVD
ncbi:MAG: class I tRNA ligase family protein [Chloroflexota bacterium]|nr:MAG: class I tRNA ligase family protein [Chloroflexota bacterium]